MIEVWLNDEPKALPKDCNLAQAIDRWQLQAQTFAVAVNQQFVPKINYPSRTLVQGDRVDLVVPMQGG